MALLNLLSSGLSLRSLIEEDEPPEIDKQKLNLDVVTRIYKDEYALFDGKPAPEPSPIRISTMTITCQLGVAINLAEFFKNIPVIDYWEPKEGIIQIDYTDKRRGISKRSIFRRASPEEARKPFFNQTTLVYKWYDSSDEDRIVKEANIKIFLNGGLQMTGVPTFDVAERIINSLADIIKTMAESVSGIIDEPESIEVSRLSIQLVNSDFDAKFPIDRFILYKVLTGAYKLFASFEATAYQGVNTKFYWNSSKTRDDPTQGYCTCTVRCDSKTNDDPDKCKKITISPFQTGKVIITGARTVEQIDDAYYFICNVFRKYYGVIRKRMFVPVKPEPEKNKKKRTIRRRTFTINKSSIVNADRMRTSPPDDS